jgi:hypothetical protein
MFRSNKIILFILTGLVVSALSACTLGQTAEPTATPFDVNAVQTSAAATAHVQLTQIAQAVAATATPTTAATATATQAATDTLAPGAPTPTQTATLQVIGGPTATGTPIGGGITPTPSPTSGVVNGPVCKNAAFNGDVTIPDGTVMKPWEKFVKVWKVKNTGTCKWDQGFYFAGVIGPPSMTAHPYYIQTKINFVAPGDSIDIDINMYAPGDPGEYTAHWHMYDDNGKPFGGDFTVVIKVVK